jgi:hypothetical protein
MLQTHLHGALSGMLEQPRAGLFLVDPEKVTLEHSV